MFPCAARTLGHVWLRRPFGCEDTCLKALVVCGLGPTDIPFISTGEILGLKKEDISEKVIFVNIKALLI